jgi:hypothetical protein
MFWPDKARIAVTTSLMFETIRWPEDMTPSRCRIRFTNELEVEASPEMIWSLLVDPNASPSFYPGVEHVQLLGGHESLSLGTRFETNLAGQDVLASVEEFEPVTRIAWYGGPKASEDSKACRAWIITPDAQRLPPPDRGDDERPALDRVGEGSTRRFLAHTRETPRGSRQSRHRASG